MPYRHVSRQVFGLAGRLLIPASQSIFRKIGPVLSTGCSFLLTAAGQPRILTGFPIKPNLAIGYREVKRLYQGPYTPSMAICRGYCANPASLANQLPFRRITLLTKPADSNYEEGLAFVG